MAKPKKIERNLLDELLGPVDPLAYEQVRKTMMLAKKIDEARCKKNWSKVEFAREMGRKPSEVTKWLSGTHNFGVHLLTEMEMKLDIRLLNVQEEEEVCEVQLKHYSATVGSSVSTQGWSKRDPLPKAGSSTFIFNTTDTLRSNGNQHSGTMPN